MELSRLTTVAVALAALATPAIAADHPDINGSWLIDTGKSAFGQAPIPADLDFKMKTEGQDFTVTQTGGGQPESTLRLNTSGKEVTNELPGGERITSTHRWEGNVLVGDITLVTADGTKLAFKDRISISPDGKVMTMKRDTTGPMGQSQITLVMNKQ